MAAKQKSKSKPKPAVKQPGVWGIDLGQCALKAVRLEMVDGAVTATAFDYIEHPKILSQPDADPDQLAREALEAFLKRNDLKGDMVAISVPGQSGLARFVKLPPVEEKKIDAIVTFEAKQQIPFPLEEVVWDYQRIGKPMVSDGFALETEVGLFAMKRDMIARALQQFKDVNVEVHIVQMAPLALCNFVSYDQLRKGAAEEGEEGSETQCVVALDIGADNSNLVITDGEKIIWQRPIPLGGNHFTRALTKEMKLTFAKAEHIKRNAIKSPDLRKILTALRPVLNDFVNEVQRSLGFFTNTHRGATIAHMIGLGNVFRLPGLQKFLQEKLQLEVRKLSRFERLEGAGVVNAPQFTENILSLAVAYGLALQGLKAARLQTNLLPHEIRVERMVRAKKPWAVAAAAALLLAVGGLAFGRAIQYNTVSKDKNAGVKEALEMSDKAIKAVDAINSNYKGKEDEAVASKKAVSAILSTPEDRHNWILVFKYINDCLPQPYGQVKLAEDTDTADTPYQKYWTPAAAQAFTKWIAKRNPVAGEGPKKVDLAALQKQEAEVQRNLVQINIEGISCLYADDLNVYFTNLVKKTDSFEGYKGWIHDQDKEQILKKDEGKLPKKGWLFEIRGYTSHKDGKTFLKNTLLANLRYPEKMVLGQDAEKKLVKYKLPDGMKERVKDRMGYVCLFNLEEVKTPTPGQFKLIGKSYLHDMLTAVADVKGGVGGFAPPANAGKGIGDGDKKGGPAAVWTPLGEVSLAVLGTSNNAKGGAMPPPVMPPVTGDANAPPSVNLQPRLEFVVFFIWQEPLAQSDGDVPGG